MCHAYACIPTTMKTKGYQSPPINRILLLLNIVLFARDSEASL